MPYKQTEPRRHKFKKMKYKVTNWAEYNEALRQRGDIGVWMSDFVSSIASHCGKHRDLCAH
jgi:hypothetical protein